MSTLGLVVGNSFPRSGFSLNIELWNERYRDDDTAIAFDGEIAIQLVAKTPDQDEPHRVLPIRVESFRKTDAIVFYSKLDGAGFHFAQRHIDLSFPVIGECIFDRVCNRLVQYYADGQRFGDVQREGVDRVGKRDLPVAGLKGFAEVIDELKDISRHFHPGHCTRAIQLLV